MSENNIRELFKMLEPDQFEAAFNRADVASDALEKAKNEDIKARLGLHLEVMSGQKKEVIEVIQKKAHEEAEAKAKAAIKPEQFGTFS